MLSTNTKVRGHDDPEPASSLNLVYPQAFYQLEDLVRQSGHFRILHGRKGGSRNSYVRWIDQLFGYIHRRNRRSTTYPRASEERSSKLIGAWERMNLPISLRMNTLYEQLSRT